MLPSCLKHKTHEPTHKKQVSSSCLSSHSHQKGHKKIRIKANATMPMAFHIYYNETESFEMNLQVGTNDVNESFSPKILFVLVPVFLLIGAMLLEAYCNRGWRSAQEELQVKRDDEKRKGIERRVSIKVSGIIIMPMCNVKLSFHVNVLTFQFLILHKKKVVATSSSTDEEKGEKKTRSFSIASDSTIPIENDDESNCCHICLESFKEDEQIASSTNDKCVHEFHLDCITPWLMKEASGAKCPLCREDYIENDLEDVDIC